MSTAQTPEQQTSTTPVGLIAFAWAFVGVPLVYGLYQTIKTASSLFS
jgi:hypothetical protein